MKLFPAKQIELGMKAQQLLNNDAFKKGFEDLKLEYMDKWEKTPAGATEDREKYYLAVRMLKEIHAKILLYVEDKKYTEGVQLINKEGNNANT